jgi:hypothetical protein
MSIAQSQCQHTNVGGGVLRSLVSVASNAAEWLRRGLLLSSQLLFFQAMSAPPPRAAYPLCSVFRCAWPALGTAYLLPPTADEWLPPNRPARCVVEVVEQLGMSEPVRQRREPQPGGLHIA